MADKEKQDKQDKFEKQEEQKQRKEQQHKGRPQVVAKPIVSASGKEVRGIVRIAGKDLNGGLPFKRALFSIKGIGLNLANRVSEIAHQKLGVNEKTLIGELSEDEIETLEEVLKNLPSYGIPHYMLNRQKDIFSGNDIHLIGSDLTYMVKLDIDHDKDSYSWKGYRHSYGQKVRGQRTRSTGRTGMTVGVLRKAVLAKAGAGAPTAGAAQAASAPGAAPAAGAKVPSGAKPPTGGAAPKAAPAAKAAPAKKEEAKK